MMADETLTGANVVISSPAQQFMRTDIFQSLFHGKIYIGQIDKDPTDEANQISVYIQQEDGSLLEVPQPLRTNAAGYPVYNGKIVKFVTTQGHSMALYDASDVLMAYYDNVLKYDPDQFSGVVGNPDGLKVIGRAESVAQLRQIVGVPDQWINVAAYTKGTHTGGGFFYWVNDISATDDGGMFFRVNASGGWRRDMPNTDTLNIYHFGAPADGVTDAMPAIQLMHAWSQKMASGLGLSGTYGPGIQLPPGKFAISSMDLGTSEFGAFKLYGPPCNYGVVPRVTLVPINKTTTTPAFAFTARRCEVANIHWDGVGSVQPFLINRVTRGSYFRLSCWVDTDCGGRVFQLKDTIDTKMDQFYSYRGSKAFCWITWSNENPGGWDHPTAIELSNFNISAHTGEWAFSAIRAGQSIMRNGWFDRNVNAFDISQGGWTLDNVTQENSVNGSACKYAKLVEIYCRYEQGAGLNFDASGYDPSMDPSGNIPGWVTNAYDQGRVSVNLNGSLFDCGVAAEFMWSDNVLDNSETNADTWYNVGRLTLPRLGESCVMRIVGAANWDSASGDFVRPGGTAFGSGEAVISLEMKHPDSATTTSVEAHWRGEANCPISAVKIVHAWQAITVYVRMRQYAKYGSIFIDTTGIPRWRTGAPFYFRPTLTSISNADIAAVANIVDVPARWSFNKGDYAGNGFGQNLDSGSLVLFQTNKVNNWASEFATVNFNGDDKFVQILDKPMGNRLGYLTRAQLMALSPATYVSQVLRCTDSGTGSGAATTSQLVYSDGLKWLRVSDNQTV